MKQEEALNEYKASWRECCVCHKTTEPQDVVILVGDLYEMLPSDWLNIHKVILLHICKSCYFNRLPSIQSIRIDSVAMV